MTQASEGAMRWLTAARSDYGSDGAVSVGALALAEEAAQHNLATLPIGFTADRITRKTGKCSERGRTAA
jgi:hypothetical protein